MAALVELEMHRLSKQRGAHECQRKAATFNCSLRKLPGATLCFFSFRFANFKVGKINFKVGKINFKVGKINFNVDKINFKVGKINFNVGKSNFLMSVKSTF